MKSWRWERQATERPEEQTGVGCRLQHMLSLVRRGK